MDSVNYITCPKKYVNGTIRLDGSKSISNRALIMQALSGRTFQLEGLSTSEDTRTLEKMLLAQEETLDAGHAGTSFRFMTAFSAVRGKPVKLTGSGRMKQRPIGPLVEALRSLGAEIDYLENQGYPPVAIKQSDITHWKNEVTIPADVSSQYISAMMMIGPMLSNGLAIHLEGEIISRPYIEMTRRLMAYFGIAVSWKGQSIRVQPGRYQPRHMLIEADWSAASYYYGIAACAERAEIRLEGLSENSLQGDQKIMQIMAGMGINSSFEGGQLVISHSGNLSHEPAKIDFTDCPDIAQTVAVVSAACQMPVTFSGLQTLAIKETNRIGALQKELFRINCGFEPLQEDGHLPAPWRRYRVGGIPQFKGIPEFETYQDHRMAMSFAPLGMIHPIRILSPEVVRKSYPKFWEDLKILGFNIYLEA